jgi:hypothetical protein
MPTLSHRHRIDRLAKLPGPNCCFTHETLASRSWASAGSRPLERWNSYSTLKQLDAATDRRLREIERFRGTAEAAMLCSKHSVLQVTEIKCEIWHCDLSFERIAQLKERQSAHRMRAATSGPS